MNIDHNAGSDSIELDLVLNKKSARFLEWGRLLEYLSFEARSALAKEICLKGEFEQTCDLEQARLLLDETEEAVSVLESNSSLLQDIVPDLRQVIALLKSFGMPQPLELYAVSRLLSIANATKTSLTLLSADSFPRLTAYAPRFHLLEDLRREISRCIDEGGNIADDASSELRRIRSSIRKLHSKIKDELQSLIHSSKVSKVLQEPIYTVRNGRYVLPVNANSRNTGTVNGIVHDSSQSGLTVYIEPVSVIEPTNQIRLNEAEEEREIARILTELGNLCRENLDAIDTNYGVLTEIDIIMARARLAIKCGGNKPELVLAPSLNSASVFQLELNRHPLLVLHGTNSVVPNDLHLKGRTLIITGPNTGGKTVLLKQIGLTCLMVRCGLLPATGIGSVVPLFKRIWADIGDEQSLEQSLSTFSSHMKNIVGIVSGASSGTLVLLDEIGVGTDPQEGAALAQSVLEYLNDSGAVTVSTTHYGELKVLGYTKDGFVNGSLEFDDAGITPTYRLQVGIPGSSKGTVIARRLGLRQSVVERADEILSQAKNEATTLMNELEQKLKESATHEAWLKEKKQTFAAKEEILERQTLELEQKRIQILEQMTGELLLEIKNAREQVSQITRDLQSQPSLPKAQKARQELMRIKTELNWPDQDSINSEPSENIFKPGQSVRIKSLGQIGLIESIQGDEKEVWVTIGRARTRVSTNEIEPAVLPSKKQIKKANSKFFDPANPRKAPKSKVREAGQKSHSKEDVAGFVRTSINTLDLRGMRVVDAQIELEAFLDRMALQNISPIMIIHGHGTGALKSLVRGHLSSASSIGAHRPGDSHEGGDGVTIASII